MKSILIRLSEIQRDYGLSRYALEKAVNEGKLIPYRGALAKKWASYFRKDIEEFAAETAKTAEPT
jgi:hypothetical protein